MTQFDEEERGCIIKRSYRFRSLAVENMQDMKRKQRKIGELRGDNLEVYFCKFCKQWHIGNNRFAHGK